MVSNPKPKNSLSLYTSKHYRANRTYAAAWPIGIEIYYFTKKNYHGSPTQRKRVQEIFLAVFITVMVSKT